MLSDKFWWEKDFSWSEFDKFERIKKKYISRLDKTFEPLNLLASLDIDKILFKKLDPNILEYIPPFQADEIDKFERYINNFEYVKASKVLIQNIKYFQDKSEDIPQYLAIRIEDFITRMFRLEYITFQKIGCLTNEMALILMENGEHEKAKSLFLESINEWNYRCIFPYYYLAQIYHYQKEFELEYIVLKIVTDKIEAKEYLDGTSNVEFKLFQSLEKIEYYLKNGKFLDEKLPRDPISVTEEIKKAKMLLENGYTDEGIKSLENIVKQGTYTNTVYYTLYTNYMKLEKWDCAIKICEKAIEFLGAFSEYKIERYNIYKNRAIKYQKMGR